MEDREQFQIEVTVEDEDCSYTDYIITKHDNPFNENELFKLNNCGTINLLRLLVNLGNYKCEEIELD